MSLRDGRFGQWPPVARARARYRDFRDKRIDLPLKALEGARRALVAGECDLLVLADSTCLFGSKRDKDSTRLPGILAQKTGLRVVPIAVGGLGPRYHAEFLRILGMLEERPKAVVHSFAPRTAVTQIAAHPIYSYPESWPKLQAIQSPGRIRSWFKHTGPTPEQYAAYEATVVESRWSGTTTVGAFRSQLKGIGRTPWPIEKEKLAFDFFHGEVITPEYPLLHQWTELGRRFVEYGVPVVSYTAVPPMHRGELHFPDFREHVVANRDLCVQALRATSGDRHVMSIDDFEDDDDFADVFDGTEHYAWSGRNKLADNVVDGLRELGVL